MAATEDPVPYDVRAEMGAIQTGTLQDVQSAATDCTDKVQALKDTTPDPPAWQLVIENANKQAIQNFADKVNAAGGSAINYINTLPPTSRIGAANVYSGGMAIINSAINAVSGFLGNLFSFIKDFLDRI